jgi:hypothetical protein
VATDWFAVLRRPEASPKAAPSTARWRYEVAGHTLACDVTIPDLEPFASVSHPLEVRSADSRPREAPQEELRAAGFVDGTLREVEAQWWEDRAILACEGTSLSLEFSTPAVVRSLAVGRLPATSLLVGPALPLLLFARGVLCLLASAVAHAGGAVLFLGDSGRGKSTLAARLGLRRLADDIVPCATLGGMPQALPRFPQLKLPWQDPKVPERSPLLALVELDPGKGVQRSFERLSPLAATRTLLSHTVASRLFPGPWVARHRELATTWSTQVEAYRFRFSWGAQHLPGNLEAVRTGLSRLQ